MTDLAHICGFVAPLLWTAQRHYDGAESPTFHGDYAVARATTGNWLATYKGVAFARLASEDEAMGACYDHHVLQMQGSIELAAAIRKGEGT